jgi:hypothetical protein
MGDNLPNKEIIFRRQLSCNNNGAFRLSIPPQLVEYLGIPKNANVTLTAIPGKAELLIKPVSSV